MKAIVVREYGEPEVMRLEEVEKPKTDGRNVLVRVAAVGVNPVDVYLRSGLFAYAPKLPYTPGNDAAGVVESVGPEVKRFKPGDRVYTAGSITGAYAEYTLCSEEQLGLLPENVSFEEGAGIWTPYATAFRALFQKAKCEAGETVLVHGASGGVGIAAIQWAKNANLRVAGTAGSADGREIATRAGADAVFDHLDEDHFAAIKDWSEGGVNVIVEMLANKNLERDFECLAMFGRIVIVGSRGSLDFSPRQAMTKDATIYGMGLFNAPQEDLNQIHPAIYKGLAEGYLKPFVGRRFRLEDAARAHHEIIETKAFGKIVLIVNPSEN